VSALFTDHNRKCVVCGERAGVWPTDDDGVATCPTCGARQLALAKTLQTDRYQDGESPHNKERPRDVGAPGAAT